MPLDSVMAFVRELDAAAVVAERPDGGFTLSRGGVVVGVAPNQHLESMRRALSDAVIALRMIVVSRAVRVPDDGAAFRADVERRLAALEKLTPTTRASRRNHDRAV